MLAVTATTKYVLVMVGVSILSMIVTFHQSRLLGGNSVISFEESLWNPAESPTIVTGDTYSAGWKQFPVPNFKESGGIFIHYHLYKTGGSTIGHFMEDLGKSDPEEETFFFRRIRKEVLWDAHCMAAIDKVANENKIVLYELHIEFPAPNYPTLVEMQLLLDRWRAAAKDRGVPFFAFTVLREPLAHALSFFNFFNVAGKPGQLWNPFQGEMEPTEENFLKTFQGNRQCIMLDLDAEGIFRAPKAVLRHPDIVPSHLRVKDNEETLYKKCRIQKVQDALFESLDWVGTTENLQNSTLPLMSKILLDDPEVGRNRSSRKVFTENKKTKKHKPLEISDLSDFARARVKHETVWDQQLYNQAKTNYIYNG